MENGKLKIENEFLMMNCPCCSGKLYDECCEPFHSKKEFPKTAEELMRSRYAAFAIPNGEYLWQTTLPSKRKFHDKSELEAWGKENTGQNLKSSILAKKK